jgi:hypothetical protein
LHKPTIAKGIFREDRLIQAAFDYGADYVLVVGRIPYVDLARRRIAIPRGASLISLDRILFEPTCVAQIEALNEIDLPRMKVVWNARDLLLGGHKTEGFDEARAAWGGWLCQASFLAGPRDIEPGANAILVGSRLKEFAEAWK